MMERALMKQRAGIVQKQVAAGREFKVSVHCGNCYELVGTALRLTDRVFLFVVREPDLKET